MALIQRTKAERLYQLSDLTSSPFSPLNIVIQTVQNSFNVIIITQQLRTKLAKSGGFIGTWRALLREEGYSGLTKGLLSSLMQQFLDDKVRSWIRRVCWRLLPDYVPPFVMEAFVASASHLVLYPMQVIRTRLIAQVANSKYNGIFDCFVRMKEEEGEAALATQGLPASMMHSLATMVVSALTTQYITHPILRKVPSQHSWMAALPLGTIATEFFTHPLATIVRRMQVQNPALPKSMRPKVTGSSISEVISRTRREQGLLSLWDGFSGVIIRSFAVSATMGAALLLDDAIIVVSHSYGRSSDDLAAAETL